MKRLKIFLMPALAAILLIGCEKVSPLPVPPPPVEAERTVIVYMVADNNLASYANSNIAAMEAEFSAQYGTRLLLFYNDVQGNCRLYDIAFDSIQNMNAKKLVKEYPFKTNPCIKETLSMVIADSRAYSQTDSYSMIFWSHGTGWLPQGMSPPKVMEKEYPSQVEQSAPQYSFGSVYSFPDQLEIWEMAEAMPSDLVFDYLIFDACHMASIELLYQLRKNTHFIMSSSAEILAEGYPYKIGLGHILSGDVVEMSRAFYDYYNSKTGVYRSATTSVVDCSKLDAVAAELRKLVATGGTIQTQQEFGRNLGRSANFTNLFWDLGEMATLTWGEAAAAPFTAALNDAVIFKGATPYLFYGDLYGTIQVNTFSGLTVYKPLLSQPLTLSIYETHYQWAEDSQLSSLAR